MAKKSILFGLLIGFHIIQVTAIVPLSGERLLGFFLLNRFFLMSNDGFTTCVIILVERAIEGFSCISIVLVETIFCLDVLSCNPDNDFRSNLLLLQVQFCPCLVFLFI